MKFFAILAAGILAYAVVGSMLEGASTGETLGMGFVALFIAVPLLIVGAIVWLVRAFTR